MMLARKHVHGHLLQAITFVIVATIKALTTSWFRGICQSFEDSVDEDFVPEAFPSSDEDSDEERAEVDALDKIHGMRRDKEVDVLRGAAQTIAEKYRSTPNYATIEKPQYALVDVEQLGKLLFGRCPNCQLCGRRSNMSSNVTVSSIAS